MSINTYPPVAVASTLAGNVTATTSKTAYEATNAYAIGVYTITCVNSTVAHVEFWNGNTYVTSALTSSGTVNVNLTTAATKIRFSTDTGSDVLISIQKTAEAISSSSNAVATTYTNTQNVNLDGTYYFTIVGGGGGGGSTTGGDGNAGGGGGSGGVYNVGPVTIASASTTITIGAGGSSTNDGSQSGGTGGLTSIAIANGSTYTANGGSGGSFPGAGAAGTPGGGSGGRGSSSGNGGQNATNGTESTALAPFYVAGGNVFGTTGGGGGGGASNNQRPKGNGAGANIGTGGNGGNDSGVPNVGTGYGSGGGGGGAGDYYNSGNYAGAGRAGRPGVVYAVKIF